MKLRILDEASAEFADAIARYESIESGLGVRLKQEVRAALEWIEKYAEVPRVRPKGLSPRQPEGFSILSGLHATR
jgi:hypothetical protein